MRACHTRKLQRRWAARKIVFPSIITVLIKRTKKGIEIRRLIYKQDRRRASHSEEWLPNWRTTTSKLKIASWSKCQSRKPGRCSWLILTRAVLSRMVRDQIWVEHHKGLAGWLQSWVWVTMASSRTKMIWMCKCSNRSQTIGMKTKCLWKSSKSTTR